MKALKKIMSTILVLALCAALLPAMAHADGISINKTNFPDASFRAYIAENFDTDSDGSLSGDEIAAVNWIDCGGRGIRSLKGIEFFTELTYLDCTHNRLTELDMSGNLKLTNLDCYNNRITSLNVSRNAALEELWCCSNAIRFLDVSRNAELTYLCCYDNPLFTLDVSRNTKLVYLDCSYTPLSRLDISRNTELAMIACDHTHISVLSIGKAPMLVGIFRNGIQTDCGSYLVYANTNFHDEGADTNFIIVDKGVRVVTFIEASL